MAIDFTFAENADVGVWFSQYFGDIAKLHVFSIDPSTTMAFEADGLIRVISGIGKPKIAYGRVRRTRIILEKSA